MANRFFSPNQQFCDATGLPYANGTLTFYASGTTTPLNTYSDSGLTIANTNPVVLDSAGRAGNVFLQNLAYKVVLADSNSNPIWTEDPVYSSDYSTVAQFQSGSGSPNESVAGSAGSTTIPASAYWDATNQILYICTQTGTSSTAVWAAINSSTAANVIPAPQGYLTPTSGTPIISSEVVGGTNVFYTPYIGNLIPLYNGTSFTPVVFSELNLALSSSQTSNSIYDVFVFSNSGVVTIGTGPAWATSTAGSGARGTGAGTTQLTRLNGLLVNAVSMSVKNGSTTYTVAANQGTYVGSIYIDSTTGQITCNLTYGQARKWAVWNAYNRVPLYLTEGDSTASWSYSTGTIRQANGAANNYLDVFCGLAEEVADLKYSIEVTQTLNAGSQFRPINYVGINSTTAGSGLAGQFQASADSNNAGNVQFSSYMEAKALMPRSLGVNRIYPLENGNGNSTTWLGTSVSMVLTGQWRG